MGVKDFYLVLSSPNILSAISDQPSVKQALPCKLKIYILKKISIATSRAPALSICISRPLVFYNNFFSCKIKKKLVNNILFKTDIKYLLFCKTLEFTMIILRNTIINVFDIYGLLGKLMLIFY